MPKSAFGRTPADGAMQFMPFAALKGYEDMVRQQEFVEEQRHEPTEEEVLQISAELAALCKGDAVRITFYRSGQYVTLAGTVASLIPEFQTITVSGVKISFRDIASIERL